MVSVMLLINKKYIKGIEMFLIFLLIWNFYVCASELLSDTVLKVVALNEAFVLHGVSKDLRISMFCLTGLVGHNWRFDRVDDRPGDLLPGLSSICPQLNDYSVLRNFRNESNNSLSLQCNPGEAKSQFISWLELKNAIAYQETEDGIVFTPEIIDCHGYKRIPLTSFDYFAYPSECEVVCFKNFSLHSQEWLWEGGFPIDVIYARAPSINHKPDPFVRSRKITVRELSSKKEVYFEYNLDNISYSRNYAFVINVVCTNQYLMLDIRDLILIFLPLANSYCLHEKSIPTNHRIEIFDIRSQLNVDRWGKSGAVIKLSTVPKVGEISLSKHKSISPDFMLWAVEHDNTLVLKKFNINDAGMRLKISGSDDSKSKENASLFLRFKPSLGFLPFTHGLYEAVVTIQKILRMCQVIQLARFIEKK